MKSADLGLGSNPNCFASCRERSFGEGGNATVNVNIRLLSATHNNLRKWCSGTNFARIFFTLNVVHMHIPPLR